MLALLGSEPRLLAPKVSDDEWSCGVMKTIIMITGLNDDDDGDDL